jgi:uncharacterized protein YbjT (DUF2867 family)
MRPYMAAKFAADAHLRLSSLPYVIVKPGRLSDDAATERFAASVDEAGDNQISRGNVACALLYVAAHAALENTEFTLLDGKRSAAEVMA